MISEMEEYVNSLFDVRKHDIIKIIKRKNLSELKLYKDNHNIKEFHDINDKYFNIQEYCCSPENQVPNSIKEYVIHNFYENRIKLIELLHKKKFNDIKDYVQKNKIEIKSIDDEYFSIIEYCRSNRYIPEWMTNFIISHYTLKRYNVIELIRAKKIKELIEYMKSDKKEEEDDEIEFISLNDENFDIVEFCKDENNKVADFMKSFIFSHLTKTRSKVVEILRENSYTKLKSYTKNVHLEFKTLNDENFNIYEHYRISKNNPKLIGKGRSSFFSKEINDFMIIHHDNNRASIVDIINSILRSERVKRRSLFIFRIEEEEEENMEPPKTFEDLENFVINNDIKFEDINDENFDIIEFLNLKNKSKEITNFIFEHFSEERKKVMNLIEHNQLLELKSYTINDLIILKDLNDKSFDILLYAFNVNASNEMINFIIQQRGYDFSKYNSLENSPLYKAFSQGNIELVNLLLRNTTNNISKFDINQYKSNLTTELIRHDELNKKIIKYLIYHGYKVKYLLISFDINNKNNDLYQYVIKKYIFDNSFIFSLINMGRNNIALSKVDLNMKFEDEKRKIRNISHGLIYDNIYDNNNDNYIIQLLILIKNTGNMKKYL